MHPANKATTSRLQTFGIGACNQDGSESLRGYSLAEPVTSFADEQPVSRASRQFADEPPVLRMSIQFADKADTIGFESPSLTCSGGENIVLSTGKIGRV